MRYFRIPTSLESDRRSTPMAGGDRPQNGLDLRSHLGGRSGEPGGVNDEAVVGAEIHGPYKVALPWTLMGASFVVGVPAPILALVAVCEVDVVRDGQLHGHALPAIGEARRVRKALARLGRLSGRLGGQSRHEIDGRGARWRVRRGRG